jgi:hypothetical protein
MLRTLYAWQDKDSLKYYLSAFPPVDQSIMDDPALSAQLTEAAKYRPAVEFETKTKLDQEVARRSGVGRVPAVILKWDVGSPNGI